MTHDRPPLEFPLSDVIVTDAQISTIPGWFRAPDIQLFRLLLDETAGRSCGDLVELGAYLGRSAVLIGSSRRDGENFFVVDTFGAPVGDLHNLSENVQYYGSLTRRGFETHYLQVHSSLPTVRQGLSSSVVDMVAPGSCRFVHVDASHLFQNVQEDIRNARFLLQDDGVVVLDDYRSPHTPGVAAAVWNAVAEGLKPFALTDMKMYATWGDAGGWHEAVELWRVGAGSEFSSEEQLVAGHLVQRFWAPEHKAERFLPPVLLPVASSLLWRLRKFRNR